MLEPWCILNRFEQAGGMTDPDRARRRWGIQHDFAPHGERPHWRTIGTGWIHDVKIPSCVDFWPATFRTRREARDMVQRLTSRAANHSPHWRFRAVPLEIRTKVLR